jgi:hypothetical protein
MHKSSWTVASIPSSSFKLSALSKRCANMLVGLVERIRDQL